MPEIARFFGIVIQMYYVDHAPPHLHATYGGKQARIRIDPIGVITSQLQGRVLALVIEWASLHQDELRENWRRLQAGQPPLKIQPLE